MEFGDEVYRESKVNAYLTLSVYISKECHTSFQIHINHQKLWQRIFLKIQSVLNVLYIYIKTFP